MNARIFITSICFLAVIAVTGCGTTQRQSDLQKQVSELQATTSNLMAYLRINDYLNENKQSVIQDCQQMCSTNKEVIFAAAGGTGSILDFRVEDVVFHGGYVKIVMLFLWSNADNSGGLGRVVLALDPDKQLETAGCSMVGQMLISEQELASLTSPSNSVQDGQQPQQEMEAKAAEIPTQESTNAWMSDASKNAILQAGVTVVSAWLVNAIQSSGSGN